MALMAGTRTVKLVVIGNSGVGKTSLRGQYISGRFSTGYRATIGADFITKTLSHHRNPDESVTLQIWDTAGQERFSSLSAAFFRGADAALLMYDVNQPETLHALDRWWAEFRDRAPLADEDMEDFCCVVVGNKIDLAEGASAPAVTEENALSFIDELVPRSSRPDSPVTPPSHHEILIPVSPATPTEEDIPGEYTPRDGLPDDIPDDLVPRPTMSIDIGASHLKRPSKSRSRSSQFRFMAGNGTVTTTHTALASYHTPSSSYFDVFESARSSPAPRSASPSRSPSSSPSASPSRSRSSLPSPSDARAPRRMQSASTLSTSSAPTITPSIFTRRAAVPATPPTLPRPERRPKLLFTSAKAGTGVADVFEYVARRVVTRWEWEEALEARTLHLLEASGSTIRLGDERSMRAETRWGRVGGSCC